MADEDDVSDVKPLTIWQQKAVREAHGLELEKVDIENDIVQIQTQIEANEETEEEETMRKKTHI